MKGSIDLEVRINVSKERIFDLLLCALEGGSNYWCFIAEFVYPEGHTMESLGLEYEAELPLVDGGFLIMCDIEEYHDEEKTEVWGLDLPAMIEGLKLMSEKYPRHFDDFMTGDEDADTGDIFLQLSLFKEVRYG